jgi:hypothetical protein
VEAKAGAFAEEAIRSLGRGDSAGARTFVALAADVDHRLGGLADCIYLACAEIDTDGEVTVATWDALADAVDSSDLLAVVEECRP